MIPLSLAYVGFRATTAGREYTVRVSGLGGAEPRLFVLFVSHAAFASGAARFQDAPDLCFARLRRELLSNPDLEPGSRLDLTAQELLAYREEHRTSPRR